MKDRLSKAEIRKDAVQDGVEAVTHAVGQGTQIVIGAVQDIAKTVGGLATDLFEIRDAAKRASDDHRSGAELEGSVGDTPEIEGGTGS